MPTHYAFKVSDGTEAIAREYEQLKSLPASEVKAPTPRSGQKANASLVSEVRSVIAAQDARGRWVEDGRLRTHGPDDATTRVIRCSTFVHHVEILSRFIAGGAP